jgi:hypothetical protein
MVYTNRSNLILLPSQSRNSGGGGRTSPLFFGFLFFFFLWGLSRNRFWSAIVDIKTILIGSYEMSSGLISFTEMLIFNRLGALLLPPIRFLKDPLFFASSVFLKNTKRIMALAMIMTLALMVYSLGQRQLRFALVLSLCSFGLS